MARVASAVLAFPPGMQDLAEGRLHGTPHERQAAFLALSTDVQLFVAGYGTGKTSAGAFKASHGLLAAPGKTLLCVGPTYKHTENMLDAMVDSSRVSQELTGVPLLDERQVKRSTQDRRCTFPNGSVARFYSGKSLESILGSSGDDIWFDELEWIDDGTAGLKTIQTVITRRRGRYRPGVSTGRQVRRTVYVTTTARFLDGGVEYLIARALRERRAWEAGERDETGARIVPTVGVVQAPSRFAVGRGLREEDYQLMRSIMPAHDVERMLDCKLKRPERVVYGAHVRDDDVSRGGNVIDWPELRPGLPVRVWVDWGLAQPHVLIVQLVPSLKRAIVFAEWGQDHQTVASTVDWIDQFLRACGVLDRGTGHVISDFRVVCDPTSNPGAREGDDVALEGIATLQRIKRWPVSTPFTGRDRSVPLGVSFVSALLRPASGETPRLLWARHLCGNPNRLKQTHRGSWEAVTREYRRKTDSRTGMVLGVLEHGQWSHCMDALRYGVVVDFAADYAELYGLETGRYSGASEMLRGVQ